MTLEDAIREHETCAAALEANYCTRQAAEHSQTAAWLKELARFRQKEYEQEHQVEPQHRRVTLQDEEDVATLVCDMYKYPDTGEIYTCFRIQDARVNNDNSSSFLSRLKRAVNVFFEKPITYAEVYVDNINRVIEFADTLVERMIGKNRRGDN